MFSTYHWDKDKKALYETLDEKLKELQAKFDEVKAFADEHGLSFNMDPAYGMGGEYYGTNHPDRPSDTDDGWYSSSMSC